MDENCICANGWNEKEIIKTIMKKEKANIVEMRPKFQQLRNQRTYTEVQVKEILYGFAHDLGCKWDDKKLKAFIETVFDFD